MYALALIGSDTIDTIPGETYSELLAHGGGKIHPTLREDLAGAKKTLAAIGAAGVSLPHVTDKLLADGVAAFAKSFDQLIAAVGEKRKKLAQG
jgi:transaldolase